MTPGIVHLKNGSTRGLVGFFLLTAVLLGVGACAPARFEIGPTHLANTLSRHGHDLSGTWRASGTFFGQPADGQTIVFHAYANDDHLWAPAAKSKGLAEEWKAGLTPTFWAERKDAKGRLVAHGWALSDGDKVFVAWGSDEAGAVAKDGMPLSIHLRIVRFGATGFEMVNVPFRTPGNGTYGDATPFSKLGLGHQGSYQVVIADDRSADPYELDVTPKGSRYYLLFSPIVDGEAIGLPGGEMGTGLLSGDLLIGAFGNDGQGASSMLGAGVYRLNGNTIAGESTLMGTVNKELPSGLGLGQTWRLPPTTETWSKDTAPSR